MTPLSPATMTGFGLLTLITFLPLAGAAIALFSGKHARAVALLTALACLVLSLVDLDASARGRIDWAHGTHGLGALAGH